MCVEFRDIEPLVARIATTGDGIEHQAFFYARELPPKAGARDLPKPKSSNSDDSKTLLHESGHAEGVLQHRVR